MTNFRTNYDNPPALRPRPSRVHRAVRAVASWVLLVPVLVLAVYGLATLIVQINE